MRFGLRTGYMKGLLQECAKMANLDAAVSCSRFSGTVTGLQVHGTNEYFEFENSNFTSGNIDLRNQLNETLKNIEDKLSHHETTVPQDLESDGRANHFFEFNEMVRKLTKACGIESTPFVVTRHQEVVGFYCEGTVYHLIGDIFWGLNESDKPPPEEERIRDKSYASIRRFRKRVSS